MNLFPKNNKHATKLFNEPSPRGINLRGELKELLYGTFYTPGIGRWVVYRRFDLTKTTPAFFEPTSEALYGEKYTYTDEIVKTYSYYLRSARGEDKAPMAVVSVPVIIFYLEHTLAPKSEDVIFEVPYSSNDTPGFIDPKSYGTRYDIKQIEPKHGDSGRVEFYQAIVWSEVV